MSDPGAGAAAEADAEPFPCSLILRSAARRRVQDKPGTAGTGTLPHRDYLSEDVGADERARRRRVRSGARETTASPFHMTPGMDTEGRTRSDAKTLC